jgi:methionine synthase I (cobalamin-dependent)
MAHLLSALHSGRVLLMDGAMGTELQRAGIPEGECYEHWNLTQPEKVRAIHQAYLDAGAEVLLTNTFQANPTALERHGLLERLDAINRAGLDLARSAAGPDRFVLASIGPLSNLHARTRPRSADWYPRYLPPLLTADAVLLETFSGQEELDSARLLVQLAPKPRDVPVFFSLAYLREGRRGLCTRDGLRPEEHAHWAAQHGAAALGVNCGRDIGMDDIIEIIQRYRRETDLPLFARPNAGTPVRAGDRWAYPHTPEQMARLPELLEAGVRMIGGCCGTTPEHIAAFRPVVAAWNAR